MGSFYNVYSDAAAAGASAVAEGAAAMKFEVTDAPIEPGLVSETVYATFIFEMMP